MRASNLDRLSGNQELDRRVHLHGAIPFENTPRQPRLDIHNDDRGTETVSGISEIDVAGPPGSRAMLVRKELGESAIASMTMLLWCTSRFVSQATSLAAVPERLPLSSIQTIPRESQAMPRTSQGAADPPIPPCSLLRWERQPVPGAIKFHHPEKRLKKLMGRDYISAGWQHTHPGRASQKPVCDVSCSSASFFLKLNVGSLKSGAGSSSVKNSSKASAI